MTDQPAGQPAFAHASEAEMARILDFYDVRWVYEPHTFPLLWNLDGDVVESFSPDFWLPDLDLYLEMTTLRQKLVRRKNRKLRRVRELYPDLRIKLFYARDFRALMLKYGKLALAAGLSGSLGQVPPPVRAGVAAPLGVTDVEPLTAAAAAAVEPDAVDTASPSPAEDPATPERSGPLPARPGSERRTARRRRARRRVSTSVVASPAGPA